MESHSNTESLYIINKLKTEHEKLKSEITDLLDDVQNLEKIINEKLVLLDEIEVNYVNEMKILTNNA